MAGKLSSMFDARDMTEGSPVSNLIQFSIPLLVGNLAQQLYNTVDSIVVGQYVGDNALAAVGASGPLLNLLLVLFMGVATGAGIMVSQYFGAKDRENLSLTVGNTLTLTLIAGLLMTILGVALTRPFMTMLSTPPDILDMSCDYLIIIFAGMVGCAFYNIVSGILRGLGDSMMPLFFLLLACGLNIVLDLLFVATFHMGVAGVAWATIIAQAISAIFCVLRLIRMRHVLTINGHTLRLHGDLVWRLIKLGLPAGLSQAIFSMAAIVVQSLTNSFGTAVIAASTMVMRVDGFVMMPNFTFGTAMTTFAGQNIGAGKLDRVHRGTKDGVIMALIVSSTLCACILLFGQYLMALFTDTPEVITLGVRMMRILAAGYIAMGLSQTLLGVMRGAGDTMTPMWASVLTTVVIRLPLAYLLAYLTRSEAQPTGSPDSLYISLLVSWLLGAAFSFACYKWGKWSKRAVVQAK